MVHLWADRRVSELRQRRWPAVICFDAARRVSAPAAVYRDSCREQPACPICGRVVSIIFSIAHVAELAIGAKHLIRAAVTLRRRSDAGRTTEVFRYSRGMGDFIGSDHDRIFPARQSQSNTIVTSMKMMAVSDGRLRATLIAGEDPGHRRNNCAAESRAEPNRTRVPHREKHQHMGQERPFFLAVHDLFSALTGNPDPGVAGPLHRFTGYCAALIDPDIIVPERENSFQKRLTAALARKTGKINVFPKIIFPGK